MKKIIFLVFASLLLFGCVNNFENKKEQLDLVVDRNEECQKYRDILKDKIEDKKTEVGEIFYSPTMDSCLVIIETTDMKEIDRFHGNAGLVTICTTTKKLIDVFSNELIFESLKTSSGEPPLDGYFVELNKIISEYKN